MNRSFPRFLSPGTGVAANRFIPRNFDYRPPKNAFMPVSLLIVEDNNVVQNLLRSYCGALGCNYDIVGSGAEAMTSVDINRYDLVLMDYQIPDPNGFETTRMIRAIENENKYTPIVAISGYDTPENREKSITAGMNDFLFKPFDIGKMYEILSRWLDKTSSNH